MNQTISVIVPVYNVETYLPHCVSSILSQDYEDLEVILIDDGSTDASGRICDQYAEKDPRVRVIHQNNGGAAAAKNTGLRLASGDYLTFADSDDYLEPGAYGFLMKTLLETNADAVQGRSDGHNHRKLRLYREDPHVSRGGLPECSRRQRRCLLAAEKIIGY